MTHYKLALLGFGNVGRALAQLLLRKQEEIKEKYGITYSVTGIATGSKGKAVNPAGLDVEQALKLYESGQSLESISTVPVADNFELIRLSEADVMFENTPVSYDDGQPAIKHIESSLEQGIHVSTANKGPVVHALGELTKLAETKGVKFYFESTVMDGAPIFSLLRETLPGAKLESFKGILNSTTNLILSLMEDGKTFDEAVKHAQDIGIAETDPSGDVDGWDAAIKVSALASVFMGVPIKPQDVDRTGIGAITAQDVADAAAEGKRFKLVCTAQWDDDKFIARVAPELVDPSNPMHGVSGTSSIAQFETDVLGLLSVVEDNPGPHTTAYGLLADFLNAVR
jgi:homoserine dehydrogenase